MKSPIIILLLIGSIHLSAQTLNVTGGVSLAKGAIDVDVLNQVIQQKQEEVFTRLFANIIVKFFTDKSPDDGVYNFTTYYCFYNLMTDLTVGKSKTTVSKAVINSAAELAYIYSFIKYYQETILMRIPAISRSAPASNTIGKIAIVTNVDGDDKRQTDANNLLMLNFYMEAAFNVLANNSAIQSSFFFKRPITSSEISVWYQKIGLLYNTTYNSRTFTDFDGSTKTLPQLVASMNAETVGFLTYPTTGTDPVLQSISGLTKQADGFATLTSVQVNNIKLMLLEYATRTDYLFSQNVIKTVIGLLVENLHFGIDENQHLTEVYVDVPGLILSVAQDLIQKNKRSSVSSAAWFINPRLFFTIGTSTGLFLNNNNLLETGTTPATSLKNISLASEKVGFRVKIWDGGYTRSFGPGELYKWHGNNYVWTQPQSKPLIASVYYNIYASGLLYNVVNIKTNKNFDYGFMSSNIGLIFFNGLEFSAGLGFVYKDGIDFTNSFLKLDFDIPIVDYLTALAAKKPK